MFLIKPSKEEILEGLESWDWHDFTGKEPIAVTAFGDVFFESKEGIYFLDKVSGEFTVVCKTKEELEKILNTPDGQDHYLMSELVLLARERGLLLNEGECYEFQKRGQRTISSNISNNCSLTPITHPLPLTG